jgi:asparagine synthase (glutamine-hydrolysing)
MCGILGVFSHKKETDLIQFEKSLQALKHRGPDHSQVKQIDEHVILGHTRLSIIDLSSSNHQPFAVDDRYTLTYNGEVYNYVEIREELKKAGIHFRTSGDTEVLLNAYIAWGEECVNRFNGMWSFAIYDKVKNRLFCSRDRFGVKPFAYYNSPEEFIFSSEIKPIISYKPEIKRPNYNIIANYCHKSLGAQTVETWFKDIYRLPPAHNLVVENGKIRIYKYWHYPQKVNKKLTFDQATAEFEKLFVDAVKIRMRSDVKVGSTLSSGLDSSSIVGVLNKNYPETIETFTAYSKQNAFTENDMGDLKREVNLNESKAVDELAKEFNISKNYIEVSFKDYLTQLSEAIYYLESGHSSPAIICIHQVYKEARKKVKVLLEGQGADELLGGYIIEGFSKYMLENLKRGKFRKAVREYGIFNKTYSTKSLLMLYFRSYDNPVFNFLKNTIKGIRIFEKGVFKFKYVKDNLQEHTEFDQTFNKYLYRKHTSGLVNLLHYGDALSMAESIECRLPFMDYRLVEFSFQLPYDFKVNEMQGKYIQRKAMEKYVPDFITKSVVKLGFATPLDKLITESKDVEQILLHQKCGDLFDDENVAKLLADHRKGKDNHSTLLFRILCAKIWYKTFFE